MSVSLRLKPIRAVEDGTTLRSVHVAALSIGTDTKVVAEIIPSARGWVVGWRAGVLRGLGLRVPSAPYPTLHRARIHIETELARTVFGP